jgi:hypothetical protein
MVPSECPNCRSKNLDIKEPDSQDSKPRLTLQCAACGAVVWVLNCSTFKLSKLTRRLGFTALTE